MKSIKENITNKIEINKSIFITELIKVKNVEDISTLMDRIKDQYKDATHYCYAYIIDDLKKSSDDGEPGGTAGVPIMDTLNKVDLNYILCVVIRYFGGIKLGAGGLVRAYRKAVSDCLDKEEYYDLVDGYELTDTKVEENTTTLTNTHESEVTSIKVTKEWADDDNESGKRPESVTISLLANGKEYDTIVLSESNKWTHTFTELPVYADGEEITYTVEETDVPEGYVVAYEEVEGGYIVHNVLGQGGEEPPENPQTGDNIVLYLIALLGSLVGLVSGKVYLKENN